MSRRRRSYSRRKKKKKIHFGKILIFAILLLIISISAYLLADRFLSKKARFESKAIEFYNDGDYTEAYVNFANALNEEQLFSKKTDVNIMLYIADIYMKTGEYSKASAEYGEVLKNVYASKKSVIELKSIADAMADFKKENYAGALPELQEAVEKGYTEFNMYVGACYGVIDDPDNMFKSFDNFVKEYGYNSYIYMQYASYYMKNKEYDQAISYINKGLSCDGDYAQELLLLEISYYEALLDFDTAYKKAKAFIDTYPDNEKGQEEYTFLYTRVSH